MKLHLRLLRRDQAGDTIVEVLIAVAIVSSVLMGAFYVTQRSAQAVRASQERSEAYQLLQGQVELVRELALAQKDQATGVYSGSPADFCIDTSTKMRVNATDSACTDRGGRYDMSVRYEPAGDIFRFTARWDDLSGGTSQVSYAYRIHPGK